MKSIAHHDIRNLEDLPNVGKATAADLRKIGIQNPDQLKGQDPFQMYDRLCEQTGIRYDPCVLDVFMSIVSFMEGGPSLPWWHFTAERKKLVHLSRQGSA